MFSKHSDFLPKYQQEKRRNTVTHGRTRKKEVLMYESWVMWLCIWMMRLKWHCTFAAWILTHNLTLVMRKAPEKPQLKGILQNTHYSSKLSRSSKARKLRDHLIQEKPKEACSITQWSICWETKIVIGKN